MINAAIFCYVGIICKWGKKIWMMVQVGMGGGWIRGEVRVTGMVLCRIDGFLFFGRILGNFASFVSRL